MSNYEHDRIKEVLPQIEARTSPTFCLAKWHHVTIYLHLGETHSCYHPQPHVIPLDELKDNPSALHNTKQKKLERKMMLEGEKPAGCTYCWNVEAMGDDYISDRKQRTLSIHEGDKSRLDDIINNPWEKILAIVSISFKKYVASSLSDKIKKIDLFRFLNIE